MVRLVKYICCQELQHRVWSPEPMLGRKRRLLKVVLWSPPSATHNTFIFYYCVGGGWMMSMAVLSICACHNKDVEFRGQLYGLGSLPPTLWGSHSAHQAFMPSTVSRWASILTRLLSHMANGSSYSVTHAARRCWKETITHVQCAGSEW